VIKDTIYMESIKWAGKTWWELPDSEYLLPIIRAKTYGLCDNAIRYICVNPWLMLN